MGGRVSFKHRLIRRLGLLVGVLVFANACGGAEISEGGARLGPEASGPDGGVLSCGVCGDGEMCTSGTCLAASPAPPPTGTPYGHVVPADVGVTIGVGVTAAVPTTVYSGPNPITADDTLVENVVIHGCLAVDGADNVTLRNVIVNCSSAYGVQILNSTNVTLEYSEVVMSTFNSDKTFRMDGVGSNIFIRKNSFNGGQDFFIFHDNLDEVYIEDNYMHDPIGTVGSHSDGFQFWPDVGNGAFYMRGNYITHNDSVATPNDILFTGDGATTTYLFENNFLGKWGWYTLRVHAYGANVTIRNNVYEQAYKTSFQVTGLPSHALFYDPEDGQAGAVYRCNRYEDGSFIEQQYITADNGAPVPTHDTTGCPTYR